MALYVPPEPRLSERGVAIVGVMGRLEHGTGQKVEGGALGHADGLGSVHGVRGLPSSYAGSRVAATPRAPHEAGRRVGLCAQSGNPRSLVLDGPKTVSSDHSKLSTDAEAACIFACKVRSNSDRLTPEHQADPDGHEDDAHDQPGS